MQPWCHKIFYSFANFLQVFFPSNDILTAGAKATHIDVAVKHGKAITGS